MGTGREQALVVDSDPDGRALMAAHLAEHGFDVTEAPDGRSALTALEQAPPTLVIVDVELADMAGFEILRLLRRATGAPVIVASGKAQESDRITGLDLGADAYL